jgi:hypothetical protein
LHEIVESLRQQACAGQHCDADGELHDHEPAAPPPHHDPARVRAAGFLHGAGEIVAA